MKMRFSRPENATRLADDAVSPRVKGGKISANSVCLLRPGDYWLYWLYEQDVKQRTAMRRVLEGGT